MRQRGSFAYGSDEGAYHGRMATNDMGSTQTGGAVGRGSVAVSCRGNGRRGAVGARWSSAQRRRAAPAVRGGSGWMAIQRRGERLGLGRDSAPAALGLGARRGKAAVATTRRPARLGNTVRARIGHA
jgi:hypothetical protein